MSGIAQTLFQETLGRPLLRTIEKPRWPILEKAVKLGCLSYIDLAFSAFLLSNFPNATETQAAFLCHLSKCLREGHLCVKNENGTIVPSPEKIWSLDSSEQIPDEIQNLLNQLKTKLNPLPDEIIAVVDTNDSKVPLRPICKWNHHYYLQKYWVFETTFINNLNCLLSQKPKFEINQKLVQNHVERLKSEKALNDQQADAILKSCEGCFSIICGGPGTGKTYTAGQLIKIVLNCLDESQIKDCEIVLAAPTGKAASALQGSLEKAFPNLPATIKSKTLHSLLKIRSSRKFQGKSTKKLSADIILVDESSMIDIGIISSLFSSIKPGARLIMLGDPYQLPPVESGSAFKDIINLLNLRFPGKHIFELKTCLRAELKDIVEFSEKVNQSDVDGVMNQLCNGTEGPISRIDLSLDEHPKKAKEWLLNYTAKFFPKPQYRDQNPQELIEAFNEFRLLTPLRKGISGVEEFNSQMYQRMKAQVDWDAHFAVPIIIVSNDYKRELFNGEVGVLIKKKTKNPFFEPGDAAYFSMGKDKICRRIPAILLPRFEYAYCLSVHKSQGSEFNRVLLLLPKGSEKFGREVFYTAVTRTKKKLEICGSDDILRKTLQNKSDRLSGIPLRG